MLVIPSHDRATLPELIESEQGRGDVLGAPVGLRELGIHRARASFSRSPTTSSTYGEKRPS